MRLTRIHQIAANANDLEETRAFYFDILGARFLAKYDPPGLLFFEFDGTRLLFEKGARPTTLYFWVDDLDASIAELEGKGVEFTEPSHMIFRDEQGTFDNPGMELWMAFFNDPGDNILALATWR